jgi:hypothetical protein
MQNANAQNANANANNMLASKNIVKNFVYSIANMQGTAYDRRYWNDKNKHNTKRYLTFKFADAAEADNVAAALSAHLQKLGYNSNVRRTSSVREMYYAYADKYVRDFVTYAEYVRVTVAL